MDIVDSILSVGTTIGNWFNSLITTISNFTTSTVNIFFYLIGILKTIFYGVTSLLSGVWNLIVQVFDGGVFVNVGRAFDYISSFIGGPATVFMATLMLVAIFRIGLAFVIKIIKGDFNYTTTLKKRDSVYMDKNIQKLKGERLF